MYLSNPGKKSGEKVEEVRQKMTEKNATILLVTALDEIACKFVNISNLILTINKKKFIGMVIVLKIIYMFMIY